MLSDSLTSSSCVSSRAQRPSLQRTRPGAAKRPCVQQRPLHDMHAFRAPRYGARGLRQVVPLRRHSCRSSNGQQKWKLPEGGARAASGSRPAQRARGAVTRLSTTRGERGRRPCRAMSVFQRHPSSMRGPRCCLPPCSRQARRRTSATAVPPALGGWRCWRRSRWPRRLRPALCCLLSPLLLQQPQRSAPLAPGPRTLAPPAG